MARSRFGSRGRRGDAWRGAFDFVTKPFDNDEILLLVNRALEIRQLSSEVEALRGGSRRATASPRSSASAASCRTSSAWCRKWCGSTSPSSSPASRAPARRARRPRHPPPQPRSAGAVHRGQLPPSPAPARESSCSATRRARSPMPTARRLGQVRAGRRRQPVSRRDRRHAARRCRPSCCASCRSGEVERVGGPAPQARRRPRDRRDQPGPGQGGRRRAGSARTSTSA